MTINEQIVDTFKNEKIGRSYTTGEIKDMVFEKHGTNRGSVIPSDICYNSSNWGVENAGYHRTNKRLFLKKERGVFQYVGPDFDSSKVDPHEFGTV